VFKKEKRQVGFEVKDIPLIVPGENKLKLNQLLQNGLLKMENPDFLVT